MADLTTKAKVKTYMGIAVADTSKDDIIDALIPAVSRQMERYCGRIFHEAVYAEKVWSAGYNVLYLPNYPVRELRRVMQDDLYVLELKNTSADATSASVQVGWAEDGTKTMYLNVVGGANASHSAIDLSAHADLTALVAAIAALGKGWTTEIQSGCDGYLPTEILTFAGEPALDNADYTSGADCYIPWDIMEDLTLEETQGRVKTKYGAFPTEKYIFVEYKGGYSTIPADLEMIATKIVAEGVRQAERDLTLKSEKLGDYSWTAADVSNIIATVIDRYAIELVRWKRIPIG